MDFEIKKQEKFSVKKCNRFDVKLCPVISKNSRHVICASKSDIGVFNIQTGALVSLFTKHEEDIIGIHINEKNPSEVMSSCKKYLYVWDYLDHKVSKVVKHEDFICYFLPNPQKADTFYSIKGRQKKKEIFRNVISKNKIISQQTLGVVSYQNCCCEVHSSGDYIAYINKNRVNVYDEKNEKNIALEYDNELLTCIAFHPRLLHLATGNQSGKIILWSRIKKEKPTAQKLHWHHSALHSIIFLKNGEFILSGGKEGVLVVWHMKTGEKSFIPRVGGVIENLVESSDSNFIGMHLQNNILKFLSTMDYGLSKAITFLSKARSYNSGLSYHEQLDCLVVNGYPEGIIQFYQPKTDSVKLSVDLLKENFISSVDERCVFQTNIDKVAISGDSKWMATIDVREDNCLPTERKLKFWKYKSSSKNFELACVVDPPHSGEVCSLIFRPDDFDNYMLLTTSKDGTIKTWTFQADEKRNSEVVESWQVCSLASYKASEGSSRRAKFSSDGTIVAVIFSEVTLWNPDNLSFQSRLPWNFDNSQIIDMAFGHKESSHMLLVYSSKYIVAWDLKCMAITWQLTVKTNILVSDPYSKYIAAFTDTKNKKQIMLLDPILNTPKPSAVISLKNMSSITSAVFTQKTDKREDWCGRLHYLDDVGNVCVIKDNDDEEVAICPKGVVDSELSIYDEIFGVHTSKERMKMEEKVAFQEPTGNPTSQFIRQMSATPSHILPSADHLCKQLLKSFLKPKADEANDESQVQESRREKGAVQEETEESDVSILDRDNFEKCARVNIKKEKDSIFVFFKDIF